MPVASDLQLDFVSANWCKPGSSDDVVFDELIDLAERAQDLGYGAIWLGEHHFNDFGVVSSPLTVAGYLLGRLKSIQVGSSVVLTPMHHPMTVAEEIAELDQLAPGRFLAGLGRGGYARDLAIFGVPPELHPQIGEEMLNYLDRALTDEMTRCEVAGRVYPRVTIRPRPRKGRRPALLAGTENPHTIELAARLGVPLMFGYTQDAAQVRDRVDRFNSTREHAGLPWLGGHIMQVVGHIDDDGDRARSEAWAAGNRWAEVEANPVCNAEVLEMPAYAAVMQRELDERKTGWPPSYSADCIVANGPVGSVDDARAWFEEFAEVSGVKRIGLFLEVVGGHQQAISNLERFRREVLPDAQWR